MRSSMLTLIVGCCLCSVFLVVGRAAQSPDFAGRWVLADAPTAAVSRGEGQRSQPQVAGAPVKVTVASGAGFNCGQSCVIELRNQVLTISDAALGVPHQVPVVSIRLDGVQASVVDSFSPSRQLPVTAALQAGSIVINTASRVRTKQTLSIENGRLVVITAPELEGVGPMTLTYRRQ